MANYLKRLLLFSFLLGTLPVLLTGWLSYTAASRDMEEKVKEEGGHVLLQTQMRVEQVLKTLELSAIQFVNSPEFSATANRALTEENYEEIRTLSKGLYQLQTLTGINDAYLINFKHDWLVNYRLFRTLSSEPARERFLSYAGHPDSLFWVTPGQGGGEEPGGTGGGGRGAAGPHGAQDSYRAGRQAAADARDRAARGGHRDAARGQRRLRYALRA
ncbi:hypothetical protein [Paenibacillus mucilaginosus]|uniref:hypothetical protein n=1 Tax=Paenibacillus mucilaginosus TaxID=61624 RepID=UPI00031DCABE|nr:hypothetical protein [Paenibacillus mucilaginosus]